MENNPLNPVMEQSSVNLEEDLASAITSEPDDLSFVMAEESIQHIQQAQVASDVMTQSKYAQVIFKRFSGKNSVYLLVKISLSFDEFFSFSKNESFFLCRLYS